jgi:hypothetical protein
VSILSGDMNIELWDTFNNRKISSHKTIQAAVEARRRHLKGVRKANGGYCYLTYEYRQGGKKMHGAEVDKVEAAAFEKEYRNRR